MRWKKLSTSQSGFTLIELIIVIVLISALAFIVFFVINPSQLLRESRDARRTKDVETILTAVHKSITDNKGALPVGLSTGMAEAQLGTASTGCTISTGGCSVTATSCVDVSASLTKYLKSIPIDPTGGSLYTSSQTGYSISVDANNLVTVKACGAEGTTPISQSL